MKTGRIFTRFASIAVLVSAASGCDPIVNIAGANFPSWLVSAIAGAILAILVRPIFVLLRIERYLWPLPIVYLSLGTLMSCIVYLIFFNRI
ncbi:MAG TPA: YtcA family lipoprotein [Candidatus Binataceae bacterium]|nr:YtcA family lipoprotein [Candidatus Binataceae bacterium]